MRRFLMIAAAAAIAMVGLSANQCGGGGDKADTSAPAEEAPAATESAPADSTDTSTGDSSTQ